MAQTVQASTWPTLLSMASRQQPDGNIAAVAEVLTQYNEILDDIPWYESNLPTGHETVLRTNIPTPTWRLFNGGVKPVVSGTTKITDHIGMMESYSEIDRDLAELNGNTNEWRLSEDTPIMEGFGQTLAKTLIYGDESVNPEQFTGLQARYFTKTTTNAPQAIQVLDAGGTTANKQTSIYLVVWGPQTVFGLFPKGTRAGLVQENKGIQMKYNTDGSQYEVYRTKYQQKAGLCVRDWRYVVRICNIDSVALMSAVTGTDTSAKLLELMSLALDQAYNLTAGRPVFYMNQLVRSILRVKLISKSNLWLSFENLENGLSIPRPTLSYMGYPCRRIDQIPNTEAVVS
jgi:hypothetical protein